MNFKILTHLPCLLVTVLLVHGCSTPEATTTEQAAPIRSGPLPDMSGHWEKDYQLSDDFNNLIELYIADIMRRYGNPRGRNDPQSVGVAGVPSNDAINGLARFSEEITRMPLLDIEQSPQSILIERELDFALRCDYQDKLYTRSSNDFGTDVCGWNQQRMLFQMDMGGDLSITYQLSLSPDRLRLDLTTTVKSDAVAAPIVVRNVYQRYEIPEADYTCQLTLTRSTVCSQRDKPE